MKATEFANFFDFTIQREDGIDEDGLPYKYVVSDDQECWKPRYINDVTELAGCFDSCLDDYIWNDIEEVVKDDEGNFEVKYGNYEELLKWLMQFADGFFLTIHTEIVKCLVNPNCIVNDVDNKED